MIRKLQKGRTLLVDGPACVNLISGETSVLGALSKPGDRIVVREGRRMPFETSHDSEFELTLGSSASVSEIEEYAFPVSWRKTAEEIFSSNKSTVVVIGGIDSGKTSFCTYLANLVLANNSKITFVDGDLGQSDVGPPGTISAVSLRKPVFDLFCLQPEDSVFVGFTTPSNNTRITIDALNRIKNTRLSKNIQEYLIINTDGWVEGSGAVDYKTRLVRALKPDIIVTIQRSDELRPLADSLSDFRLLPIDIPRTVKPRDRETRKKFRELSYKKYLKEAKIRSFNLGWVKMEGEMEICVKSKSDLRAEIEKSIGDGITNCTQTHSTIMSLLEKSKLARLEDKEEIEHNLDKKMRVLHEGDEKDLLVALCNHSGKFLGIGTISGIDFKRGFVKIFTPVEETISAIQVGQIKLDQEGREMEFTESLF